MRQARWTETGIEVVAAERPELAPDWVRLEVAACGICGSDLHLYKGERKPPLGLAPGHEIAGTLRGGPRGFADGLYAVEPLIFCGRCDFCVCGKRQLCTTGAIVGVARDGGLADFVDVPAYAVHKLDASVSPLLGSLAEPLAVCVRGVELAELGRDSRVLVIGAGAIGLLSGLLARDVARQVAISARHPQQVEAARRLGLVALGEAEVKAWAREVQPDVVIETVGGNASTLLDASRWVRAGGTIIVLGVFSGRAEVNAFSLVTREIRLLGSNVYGTGRRGPQFRTAVELLPRYQAELAPLLTHQFPLARLADAFACAADKKSGAIKVTVTAA